MCDIIDFRLSKGFWFEGPNVERTPEFMYEMEQILGEQLPPVEVKKSKPKLTLVKK